MLSSPQAQQGYNGTVDVMGKPVKVTNGVAEFDGQQYFVSANGLLIVNNKRQVVGYIEDGEFKPHDAKQLQWLKEQGLIEGAKQ